MNDPSMELAIRNVVRLLTLAGSCGTAWLGSAACSGAEGPAGGAEQVEMRVAGEAAALPALPGAAVDLSALDVHGYLHDESGFRLIDAPDGPGRTYAVSLNRKGEIVGTYLDGEGLAHGFLRHADGTFETIDHPDGETTFLHRINDRGQIVGVYHETVASPRQGFIRDGGSYISVTVSGAEATDANSINERGQVIGWYQMKGDPTSYAHGMIWENGSVTTIDIPESSTAPIDINEAGVVVGFYVQPPAIEDLDDVVVASAFVIQDGKTTRFTVPGYPYGSANGLNNRQGPDGAAQIVGGAYEVLAGGGGLGDGFVQPEGLGGPFVLEQVPGAEFTETFDITDCGQIVGSFALTGEPSIPPPEGVIAGCE